MAMRPMGATSTAGKASETKESKNNIEDKETASARQTDQN